MQGTPECFSHLANPHKCTLISAQQQNSQQDRATLCLLYGIIIQIVTLWMANSATTTSSLITYSNQNTDKHNFAIVLVELFGTGKGWWQHETLFIESPGLEYWQGTVWRTGKNLINSFGVEGVWTVCTVQVWKIQLTNVPKKRNGGTATGKHAPLSGQERNVQNGLAGFSQGSISDHLIITVCPTTYQKRESSYYMKRKNFKEKNPQRYVCSGFSLISGTDSKY